ncbi:MAG: hypothetical protein ISS25_00890 [Nanoarchaeota archaeon]|nr:hypothetical protein [DPANN group archaeon]MBL7116372.1 hypothetical protein [Nanoarchaeota archaeon]
MVTNQKCSKCGRKATINLSYDKRNYCDSCFLKMIEKRVRKDIRTSNKIEPRGSVKLLNDDSKEFFLTKQLLKNIFGKHLTIKEVKKASKETLIPTNLDREVKEKLEIYLENKKEKPSRKKILHNVLEEEIIEMCRIKKIKIGKKEKKNSLIESIEKPYPGTKFALAKSLKKIFP